MQVEVNIYAHWNSYSKKFEYRAVMYECNDELFIERRTIEFEPLDAKQLRIKICQVLEGKKRKIRADREAEINEVNEQIQEMLAIEDHSGDAEFQEDKDDIQF